MLIATEEQVRKQGASYLRIISLVMLLNPVIIFLLLAYTGLLGFLNPAYRFEPAGSNKLLTLENSFLLYIELIVLPLYAFIYFFVIRRLHDGRVSASYNPLLICAAASIMFILLFPLGITLALVAHKVNRLRDADYSKIHGHGRSERVFSNSVDTDVVKKVRALHLYRRLGVVLLLSFFMSIVSIIIFNSSFSQFQYFITWGVEAIVSVSLMVSSIAVLIKGHFSLMGVLRELPGKEVQVKVMPGTGGMYSFAAIGGMTFSAVFPSETATSGLAKVIRAIYDWNSNSARLEVARLDKGQLFSGSNLDQSS